MIEWMRRWLTGLTFCKSEDRGVIYLKIGERNCEPHTDNCGRAADLQDEICNYQVSVEQDKVPLHGTDAAFFRATLHWRNSRSLSPEISRANFMKFYFLKCAIVVIEIRIWEIVKLFICPRPVG